MSLGFTPVRVFVLSITRDLMDDLGAEVADAVAGSGHDPSGRDLVLPKGSDPDVAVGRRLHDKKSDVVLVCGSATIGGQTAGTDAVTRRLRKEIPGLRDAWRAMGGPEDSDIKGGYTEDGKLLFTLTEPPALAAAFAREHILPRLTQLVADAEAALAAPDPSEAGAGTELATTAEPAAGVSVTQIKAPPPDEERPAIASGWEAGLRGMKGTMKKGWPTIPEAFGRMAACNDVLDTANQRAIVTLNNGRTYGAFGWPDLNRPDAKILLVGEGEPVPEIIALHRYPHVVGTVTDDSGLKLASGNLDELSTILTGAPLPTRGELFAVEGKAVYIRVERRIWRWDGRRETDEGTVSQAMASLMLRWSQK